MNKGKILAFIGMALLGAVVLGAYKWQVSRAQTTGPRPLQVKDIDSIQGMSTSNPLANYPAGNSAYPGQEVSFDNEGISIFIAPSTQITPITTDGNIPECGHVGLQEWKGANYAYKLADANTWQKRRSTCNGIVVIGSSGQIRAQTLTIKGTSMDDKPFTLQVNVPDPSLWDGEVGGGSRRLYVDDTGATYVCKNKTTSLSWPNECEFSPQDALQRSPVGSGFGLVCGNGLCQAGETYSSCVADCPAPAPTCTLTPTKTSYTKPEYVNYTYTCSSPTSVAVQVVKPNGTATTYNTATNITTSTMGFDTSNLDAGNYTLRICVNDTTCSASSLVSVPFTISAPSVVSGATCSPTGSFGCAADGNSQLYCSPSTSKWQFSQYCSSSTRTCNASTGMCKPICGDSICGIYETAADCPGYTDCPVVSCAGMSLSTNKTSYSNGEGVTFNYSCQSPAGGVLNSLVIQVIPPNKDASSALNVTTVTPSSGSTYITLPGTYPIPSSFFTSNGSYLIRTCMNGSCTTANTNSVSVNYTVGATTTISSDLLGYWKFDGNGNNEVSGNPAAITVGNASFKSSGGKLDGYAYIPTSSDYVKIPYNSIFDLPDSFTIEFWFRQRADQSFFQDLVYKGTPINNYNFRIFRQLWNQYNFGPIITGYTASATGYWTQTSNPNQLTHNTWHHVAFTKSTSGRAYYLDGALTHGETTDSPAAKTPHNDIIIGDSAVDTDIDNLKIYNRALSASEAQQNSGFSPTTTTTITPGASAPEPLNNDSGVWAQVDIATGQVLTTAICTRSVCGINGEYHGYVPPSTFATGSTWWPTTKRYIWQLPGQAGYGSGTFNFSTYVFTVAGGTIYNGVFTPTTTTTTSTTTAITTPTTPVVTTPTASARACANGEKCPSGSWCSNGSQCYYPDGQITCAAWPSGSVAGAAYMSSAVCPAGTSPCNPTDTNCVGPMDLGQTVPFLDAKWCSQSMRYISTDGKNMKCVRYGEKAPDGYTSCRPSDTNCIPENGYGSSSGWCGSGMICHQKTSDSNPNNDIHCPAPLVVGATESASCPAGYSYCSSTDTLCKQKGDSWTDTNANYMCMNSQKCLTSSGGLCVGMNDQCPAGTKYCSPSEQYCVEPGGQPKTMSVSGATMSGYWCGGSGASMIFYSPTKVYCERKALSSGAGAAYIYMWTGAEIKAVLDKLGAGWKLCGPSNSMCIEPGETGSSSGWCAWSPPGSYSTQTSTGSTRYCPALAGNGESQTGTAIQVVEQPVCMTVLTKALNTSTGECKVFSNSCLPQGWVRNTDCKPGEITPPEQLPMPVPGEMRECGPNELPGMMTSSITFAGNSCVMPMYRWNIAQKTWEKCDRVNPPTYVNVKDNPKAQYTNCESMNFAIEKEWRTERYIVHPPQIDGEWYMPPWDAATKQLQYNPATDQFEECGRSPRMNGNGVSTTYIPPCTPVSEIDKGWMLKKARAEYKLAQLWNINQGQTTVPGQPTPVPMPFETILPQPVVPQFGAMTVAQCKTHIIGVRQSLAGDKQFLRDVRMQLAKAPKNYPDFAAVEKLLNDAKLAIADVEKAVKNTKKCNQTSLSSLQEKLDVLHTEVFPDISSYMPDIQEFVQFEQCRVDLKDQLTKLKSLSAKKLDGEMAGTADDLAVSIESKLQEFEAGVSIGDYDVSFECQEFSREINEQTAPLLLQSDSKINEIVDTVITQKLEPVLAKLTEQLEDRGKKLDALLVRVAQLHQAVDAVSKSAMMISDQITVSYTALTFIEDKFAAQKTQIQSAKERLIPLIEKAVAQIKTSNCVSGDNKNRLIGQFGNIAAVNWIGEKSDELDRKLNLFATSCGARTVTPEVVAGFVKTTEDLVSQNMKDSYKDGLTPFADVPTHEWYFGGMLNGYKTGFITQGRPGENVLRQDALLMVLRASGMTDDKLMGDCVVPAASGAVGVSPYAKCAVAAAVESGLLVRGDMAVPISRAEVASWISKLIALPMRGSRDILKLYIDLGGVSTEQLDAIADVVANKVMVGQVSETKAAFEPRSPLTRAALSVILDKLLGIKNSANQPG